MKKITLFFSYLSQYKSLLFQLVRRDFKAKYKRSVLGILWTILNPLFTMLVLTIVFSALFRFDIDNYPVYLLSGQLTQAPPGHPIPSFPSIELQAGGCACPLYSSSK